ncbi:MAG: hypothetical protein ABIT01_12260 [Thermoanaerobaculia bacterium]
MSRDGRAFTQYEVAAAEPTGEVSSPQPASSTRATSDRSSMLACVALKAAAASHGAVGCAGDVIKVAELYEGWIEQRGPG